VVRRFNQYLPVSLNYRPLRFDTKTYRRTRDPALPRCGSDFMILRAVMVIALILDETQTERVPSVYKS